MSDHMPEGVCPACGAAITALMRRASAPTTVQPSAAFMAALRREHADATALPPPHPRLALLRGVARVRPVSGVHEAATRDGGVFNDPIGRTLFT